MTGQPIKPVHVIGGGLAGSEAAWALVRAGVPVLLHEMRPKQNTAVHQTGDLGELVCSNSLRSDDAGQNAVGLLHEELRRTGSLIMAAADANRVPAGSALAVDRIGFAKTITETLEGEALVTIVREELDALPPEEWGNVIIATGPLTSPALGQALTELTGEDELAFFDAIAPIVYKDSIDFSKTWFQSRYDKTGPGGTGADYINCPFDASSYNAFIDELLAGDTTEFRDWETSTPYFEGCLPIEVMAARGRETLRFGPMKPVGLTNPHDPETKSHAIVQLRQDNALASLYNMVGFQTKLAYGEQKRIFSKIPGLENVRFARLGGLHRNTFLNSPKLLNETLELKHRSGLRFAGQITGVEGYVESAAIGLLAGQFAAAQNHNLTATAPPPTTALGALLAHITGGHLATTSGDADSGRSFQPMNINFGLFPPMDAPTRDADGNRLRGKQKSRARKQLISARALDDLATWHQDVVPVAVE